MKTRAERLADARTWAGYRSAHFAKTTGTLVVVVDAYAQGLATPDDDYRWFTICDDHNRLCSHPTLKLARYHAVDPEGWCGVCNYSEAEKAYEDRYRPE